MPVAHRGSHAHDGAHDARAAEPSWWNTQAAPLDGTQLIVMYVLMAFPPVVAFGGVAAWAFLLWIPTFVLTVVWSKAKARSDGAPARSMTQDLKANLIPAAVFGACFGVGTTAFADRLDDADHATLMGIVGLVAVLGAVALEPFYRRRYRRSLEEARRVHPS